MNPAKNSALRVGSVTASYPPARPGGVSALLKLSAALSFSEQWSTFWELPRELRSLVVFQEHCVNVHFRCGEPTSVIDRWDAFSTFLSHNQTGGATQGRWKGVSSDMTVTTWRVGAMLSRLFEELVN